MEVLSPSTWQRDRIEKWKQYEKYGVKEYLLIYPIEKVLKQYVLRENNRYGTPSIFNGESIFTGHKFSECTIKLYEIFYWKADSFESAFWYLKE
jgi:Uma2 family endonuclease